MNIKKILSMINEFILIIFHFYVFILRILFFENFNSRVYNQNLINILYFSTLITNFVI